MTSAQNCAKVPTSSQQHSAAAAAAATTVAVDSSSSSTSVAAFQQQQQQQLGAVAAPTTTSSASSSPASPAVTHALLSNAAAAAAAAGTVSPYTGRQMSRHLLEEFMVAYRHNQCLWKIKSKDYLNKDLKFEAYKQLVQICRKEHRTAGREFVVKKINSLRGSFRREYKRVITEENYVPQLWFYDLMQFTADQETSDEMLMGSAAAAAAGGLGAGGPSGGAGAGGAGAYGIGCFEYNSYGDDSGRDKFKSEDDDNSNSNLSYQILQAYDPSADEYAHCLESDAVDQELIINSTNPMVDGNGQEAVAASAAVISESTSVGLDYIANNLNIQHHETCPPSEDATDVLDDVEENIIEPDVILPATLMSDDSSVANGGGVGGGVQADMSGDGDADVLHRLTPTLSVGGGGGGFTNGGSGGLSGTPTSSNRVSSAAHSLRTRRALRRNNAIHKDIGGGGNNGPGGGGGGHHNGLKPATAYDEFMAFGVTVAAKLSKMNTYQRLYAENIINQTLFKGMLNQLQPPEFQPQPMDVHRSSPGSPPPPTVTAAVGSPRPTMPTMPTMPTTATTATTTAAAVIKRESP